MSSSVTILHLCLHSYALQAVHAHTSYFASDDLAAFLVDEIVIRELRESAVASKEPIT